MARVVATMQPAVGFEEVALRRVVRIVNGGTPSANQDFWDGDIEWATPVDLAKVDGGTLGSTDRRLTSAGLAEGSRVVPGGSLVISTRAPIGYVALVDQPTAFNQGCRGLVPGDRLDPRFLQLTLMARKPLLESLGTGSTFKELSTEALGGVLIPLPGLEEQRRIADFLDDHVTRMDAINQLLDERSTLLAERHRAVVDDVIDACGDRMARLSHLLVSKVMDGPHETPEFLDEGVPFLSVDNIKDDHVDWNVSRFISQEAHEEYARKCAPRLGDVLLTKAASVGKVAVIDSTEQFNIWSPIAVLRPAVETLRPEYLAWALRSSAIQASMRKAATNTTQDNLAMRDIAALRVPLPDMQKQNWAVALLDADQSRHSAAVALSALEASQLEERKRALITVAVTGELDVTTAKPIGMGKLVPNVGASVEAAAAAQASGIGGIG